MADAHATMERALQDDAPGGSERASLPGQPAPTYLDELLSAGLLVSTGVDGLYGRSAQFEDLVERISALLGTWAQGRSVEVLRFPPAMSREVLEQSGYLRSFPDQVGATFSFCGSDREHLRLLSCLDRKEDWSGDLRPTRIVMTPVACYPVYPVMARRGPLPQDGRTVDIFSYCFRHEPSLEAERMQMFRQREFVRLGSAAQVEAFRQAWLDYAQALMVKLELPHSIAVANDPFFGRAGKIAADSQRAQELKFELLIPAINPGKATACGSFNYHTDHFGHIWDIRQHDGEIAHTGCCGFGLERLALSLLRHHGLDCARWPAGVRETLWGA